ncbi:MAG TPA: 2-C-methyl-D-erythritol 4-phosphate cytidylyltransferase [Terriglobales bacterium]|jgi:2-C-methyl-D-erythritol 4-phosphate cytidylyltransferase
MEKAYAIIPAAGLSTRMGSTTTGQARKPLIEVGGAPILIHTLRKWDGIPGLAAIYVPARAEDLEAIAACVAEERFQTPVRVLEGGNARQESVWNALEEIAAVGAVAGADPLIAVHDAVRPFVARETITAALTAAERHGAVIVALPAVDTVKQVERSAGDSNRITATLQRERIVLAQTPQVFRLSLLRQAYAKAIEDGFHATDEAALVEHFGHDVFVVPGSAHNWKITTPADLPLAQIFLSLLA